MIVLHVAWTGKSFFIWAEQEPGLCTQRKRGRPPKNPGGLPHSFQAPVKKISSLLSLLYPDVNWGKVAKEDKQWILLPTGKRAPLPSPGLSAGSENGEYKLAGWEITGLSVPIPAFIEGIVACNHDDQYGDEGDGGDGHLIFGDDWNFWVLCGQFMLRMLCRQKFIPSLAPGEEGGVVAVWQPVFEDPEDRGILKRLISAMPPVCCGVIKEPERHDGELAMPYDVIMDYLRVTTDELIRTWLGDFSQPDQNAPVERKWLYALRGKERSVIAPKRQIEGLVKGLKEWTAILRENRGGFRTCLRLEEPRDGSENWYLSFHLQATDDPSLLVSARDVWQMNGKVVTLLNRQFEHPQERLLEDLGKILKIYPPIERGLMEPRPEGMFLTTEEAYFFLKEISVLLQDSGFGVLVPSWWRERKKRMPGVRLRLCPVQEHSGADSVGRLGLDSFVEFDWKLSIGQETIDYEEFKQLAALKKPLVRIRGQWVELNPRDMEAVIRWLNKQKGAKRVSLKEALGMVMAVEDDGPDIKGIDSEGWLHTFLQGLAGSEGYTILDTPSGFCGKLRPYQVRGFSWLAFLRARGFGACLADDMGLGKTVQVIAMLLYERECLGVKGPTLLICPTSVVGNWMREIARFAPGLKTFTHHGTDRATGNEFVEKATCHDLVISTYNLVHRDLDVLAMVKWKGIVLDEAQNIKTPSTKQAQSVRKLKSEYRIALTGTPIENRLMELWSIMEFLNPGYLGSRESFRRKFVIPIEKHGDERSAWQLKQLIKPFILRRVKTDPAIIQDLPLKQENKVYCTLTREQATLYQAVLEDTMKRISTSSGIERRGLILSLLTKLKQICDHPALFLGDGSLLSNRSGKLMRLVEMLDEILSEGDKALIFTQYAKMGRMLQAYLQRAFQREVLFFHGGIRKEERDRMIERFQTQEGPDIFVLSLKAGGVGLNLTRANHVFHFDRWWNPAVENQATDRAFRIGQQKNVQVHKYICIGTLEEKIDTLIEKKRDLADKVVSTGEAWLTELSDDELRNLFALESEAVRNE